MRLTKSISGQCHSLATIAELVQIATGDELTRVTIDSEHLGNLDNPERCIENAKEYIGEIEYNGDLNIGAIPAVGEYLDALELFEHMYSEENNARLRERFYSLYKLGLIDESKLFQLEDEAC